MAALRLFWTCVVRSRCPCCAEGPIFDGALHCRSSCPRCGLVYDQWVGEWITPTYIASSLGMLAGFVAMAVMLATGAGLDGPLPPEVALSALGVGVALLALRPSKTGWLAFLYWVGGVEVSARTRAHLRWEQELEPDQLDAAERRARSRPEPATPVAVVRRFTSLRGLLMLPPRGATPPPSAPRSHPRHR